MSIQQQGVQGTNTWHPPSEFSPGAQAYLHQQEPLARATIGTKEVFIWVCPRGDQKQIQAFNLNQMKQWIYKHKEFHIHRDWIMHQSMKGLDKYGRPKQRTATAQTARRPRGLW